MRPSRSLEPVRRSRSEQADRLIAELAGGQHGVLSRTQLLDAGVSRHAIHHRIERARLHVVHRGVYAAGHQRLTREGRWMAAVLATDGSLSHRAAAALWELLASRHLEVIASTVRRRPRILVHRSPLLSDEMTTERGIPVTGVSRTVFDLAALVRLRRVERALNEVEILD